ncbi:MAG: glycosyl hydrolase [Abditibacteriaceae bacterium]
MSDPRIAPLQAKIKRVQILAAYRELADIYLNLGCYDEAAATIRAEAAQYRKKNLIDAAIVKEQIAARYTTDLRLFVDRVPTIPEQKALFTGVPVEPASGCYIGAFVENKTPQEWAQITGKTHSSFYIYRHYTDTFPRQWAESVKAAGAIPQIAWEPRSLNEVHDDEHLHQFARDCADFDWPIIIRFASEMNGNWTSWHGNPKLYKEKFRLIHRVLHAQAPKVAMLWCVNNPPLGNIADYYPGDDGCDWVGVNFYSVPFLENKRDRPAFLDSPLTMLDTVYKMYAAKKPIAIGEYAASHMAALDRVSRPTFADEKMALLYGALPLLYPRVKLISWFDRNTLKHPVPGKTLGNYNIEQNANVLATYQRLIADPYFLSAIAAAPPSYPAAPYPLLAGQKVRGVVRFSVWASTYVSSPKVYFKLDNAIIYARQDTGAHHITVDFGRVAAGRHAITVYLFDDQNRFITSRSSEVLVVP